ncbi:hypothetical protein ABT001_20100 [Streptomyces sp. NPDC002793]|uniref:hypothetical protein n=1 Tax=Streptomyces sp. NPDC002793 TaxID=3154432 RepID=UPI003330A2D6
MTTREPGQGMLPRCRLRHLRMSCHWAAGRLDHLARRQQHGRPHRYRGPPWDSLLAAAVPGLAVGSGRRARSWFAAELDAASRSVHRPSLFDPPA